MAIAARVTVSMFAETIGRLRLSRRENRDVEIDGRRVATLDNAVVRREEEVVERAAANE